MKWNDQEILATAQEAARKAGAHLRKQYGKQCSVTFKGEINLVTQVDLESQEIIREIIKNTFPSHSILGEEDLDDQQDQELLWVIDPIDGTTNFAHALPVFCVSIAFMASGISKVGVVYIPLLEEMFHAVRGGGAYLNGKQLAVSTEENLGNCLLATGFPYDRRESKENNLNHFNKLILKVRGIRRMGSAAIDLCYTAAGRFSGFWEPKLHPWDTAAGYLLVEEAGGKVTDFSGQPFSPELKECLATNGRIHDQMVTILNTPPV